MEQVIPFRLGPYEIKSALSGGRSKVYSGYDQNLGNDVVIKFLPFGFLTDSGFRERFESEIRVISLSSMPSVVPIYDIGEEEGQFFLVSRFMPGGSLADLLREGPLSLAEAVSVTSQLAVGLHAAHQRGVLHRNIKPSNILFDEEGAAYLADFGLVRRDGLQTARPVNLIDGAPAYASPEQALGRPDLDGRSDIYSLGAILYEMLTGQSPYISDSLVELAVNNVREPYIDILKLKPGLPIGCTEVVNRAMAKNPEKRYHTAIEFARDLIEKSGIPINLPALEDHSKESLKMKTRQPSSRLRWALTTILLLILLSVGTGFAMRWFSLENARSNLLSAVYFILPSPSAFPTSTLSPHIATPIVALIPTSAPTLSATPTWISIPTSTATDTPVPTITSTPTPVPLVIGMADKIAFIVDGVIWMANLDGSNLTRILEESSPKTDLQWTPDGKGLIYLSKGCHYLLDIEERNGLKPMKLGCFEDFEISPDMIRMVIGGIVEMTNKTNRWRNFIGPYDLTVLHSLNTIPLEETMGGCPYAGGRLTRFSPDSETMAAVFSAPAGVRNMDVIQVYRMRECGEGLDILDSFPGSRFEMGGYSGPNDLPTISDYGWDGDQLFALHGNGINGYGVMVIYNMSKRIASIVNPIDGQCCYQDIQFSPDGQYLLFVYQDARQGKGAEVYYIPYNTLGTGMQYQPLNLPILSSNPKARIEPALREYRP
jgi:serine/threonine-protein kinase